MICTALVLEPQSLLIAGEPNYHRLQGPKDIAVTKDYAKVCFPECEEFCIWYIHGEAYKDATTAQHTQTVWDKVKVGDVSSSGFRHFTVSRHQLTT